VEDLVALRRRSAHVLARDRHNRLPSTARAVGVEVEEAESGTKGTVWQYTAIAVASADARPNSEPRSATPEQGTRDGTGTHRERARECRANDCM